MSNKDRLFLIFSILVLFLWAARGGASVKVSEGEISAQELKSLDNDKVTLINVHVPYEGEIANTDAFIEYDSLLANKSRLPEDKNAPIVLYCKSGNMSEKALVTLKNMGYTNVSHLAGGMNEWARRDGKILNLSQVPEQVIPEEGLKIPISWGNIGPELVKIGVIDANKFSEVMGLTDDQRIILLEGSSENIKINSENSRFVVNILWAFGLAQKSIVYEKGPMGTDYKSTVGNFASTGGWTLAKTDAVNYLGKHSLVKLDDSQQERVGEIAKNVFRPCCGNNTWFPDCNHGMAALGAIELMVAQNLSDEEIYKSILTLNSYWFPETYISLATFYGRQGMEWGEVDARKALSAEFSSAQGASELYEKVGPLPYDDYRGGGSCGA